MRPESEAVEHLVHSVRDSFAVLDLQALVIFVGGAQGELHRLVAVVQDLDQRHPNRPEIFDLDRFGPQVVDENLSCGFEATEPFGIFDLQVGRGGGSHRPDVTSVQYFDQAADGTCHGRLPVSAPAAQHQSRFFAVGTQPAADRGQHSFDLRCGVVPSPAGQYLRFIAFFEDLTHLVDRLVDLKSRRRCGRRGYSGEYVGQLFGCHGCLFVV